MTGACIVTNALMCCVVAFVVYSVPSACKRSVILKFEQALVICFCTYREHLLLVRAQKIYFAHVRLLFVEWAFCHTLLCEYKVRLIIPFEVSRIEVTVDVQCSVVLYLTDGCTLPAGSVLKYCLAADIKMVHIAIA